MFTNNSKRPTKLTFHITLIFLLVSGISMYYGNKYISNRLLLVNEHYATDIALLVANNFKISNEEVAYMKGLTFNDMEVDPINYRLMKIGDKVKLNSDISNIYILSSLADDEIKYTTDEKTSAFFNYPINTKLNGIWLLNGKIENRKFIVAQRDDIYRYTKLTPLQIEALKNQKALGEFTSDVWGNFITGYAPIFTKEGNFVGLLGIDIAPDKFQENAQHMIYVLLGSFSVITITICFLFLYFYYKYIKAKENELYFKFYSNMSHDLRTPMNGILGTVELAQQESDPRVLHNYFEFVKESGKYMLTLINDSLDLQKLDTKKLILNIQSYSLEETLAAILDIAKPVAHKKRVNLINKAAAHNLKINVEMDSSRFQQILLNIIFNAIKFTPENGTVTFDVETLSLTKNLGKFKFTISDTGIGMNSSFVKNKLFHPFEQELRISTGEPSSGLGLSIVKNLLDLMDGKIEVISAVNEGTTFTIYIDFPIAKKECSLIVTESLPTNTETLEGKNILLCEDQQINIEVTSKLLLKKGCKVSVAHNGQEGIDLFSNSSEGEFDAILMDMRMPIVDGLEATKTIRNLVRKDSQTIPIIAVSANTYEKDIALAKAQGITDYIKKPINPQDLYQILITYTKK